MNYKLTTFTFLRLNFHLPSMRLHNIVSQAQSQTGSLAGGFGCEERLEDFIQNILRDAGAIIFYNNFYPPSTNFLVCTETVGW
jgi:hypothetical protein